MTKTPGINMAKNIQNFRKLFNKESQAGIILCMSDKSIPLSRNIKAEPVIKYLESIKGTIK